MRSRRSCTTHGLSGLWLDLAGAAGLLALGLFLAGRVRREGAVTLPEIVGRYYGATARRVAGALVLVSEIVWFALLIEATQVVLSAALGLEPVAAIVGSTAVFVLYTALGGQFAVVRTDAVQYGLMVLGIPGVAFALRARAFGRLSRICLPRRSPFRPRRRSAPVDVLSLLVLIGLPHLVGSDVYAKLLSCRDERTARRAALGAALSKVLFGCAVAAIALGRPRGAAGRGRHPDPPPGGPRLRARLPSPRSCSCAWSPRCIPRPTPSCSRRPP